MPGTDIRINLADAEDVKCDSCGGMLFEPAWPVKRVSSLLTGTGKAELIPLGPPVCQIIFSCMACGHVNEEFLPLALRSKKPVIVDASSPPAGAASPAPIGPQIVSTPLAEAQFPPAPEGSSPEPVTSKPDLKLIK